MTKPISLRCALICLLLAGAGPVPAAAQQIQPPGVQLRLMRDHRIEGRRAWIVMEDAFYCYPLTGDLILIRRGYITDFASIPDAARGLIDVEGDNIEAALVHDWLYAVGEPGGKDKADVIFRYALMEQKVGLITRNAMYQAVSHGAGDAYGRADEWRFGDPARGQPGTTPPPRPGSAVVTRLTSCQLLERWDVYEELRSQYAAPPR